MRSPEALVSWGWWEQERLKISSSSDHGVEADDGEEERSGEEAMYEETTGRR